MLFRPLAHRPRHGTGALRPRAPIGSRRCRTERWSRKPISVARIGIAGDATIRTLQLLIFSSSVSSQTELACLSADYQNSKYCRSELKFADLLDKQILPVAKRHVACRTLAWTPSILMPASAGQATARTGNMTTGFWPRMISATTVRNRTRSAIPMASSMTRRSPPLCSRSCSVLWAPRPPRFEEAALSRRCRLVSDSSRSGAVFSAVRAPIQHLQLALRD